MKFRLLLLLLIIPRFLAAEGSNEVWRDLPNHITYLYICTDLTNHCAAAVGSRSNFAAYGCVVARYHRRAMPLGSGSFQEYPNPENKEFLVDCWDSCIC